MLFSLALASSACAEDFGGGMEAKIPGLKFKPSPPGTQCPAPQQALRSQELRKLAQADQADRQGSFDSISWDQVTPRDKARRARVGEIAAEGCLTSAQDYAAAALVYQHGDAPEHYFHAFLWWQKAVELGDASQKIMMAKGADRYLVNVGYKQLFATQATTPSMNPADCWCLEEVAAGITEERRVEFAGRSVKEALQWVDSLNAQAPNCGPAAFCRKNLKDPPKGTLPGLW